VVRSANLLVLGPILDLEKSKSTTALWLGGIICSSSQILLVSSLNSRNEQHRLERHIITRRDSLFRRSLTSSIPAKYHRRNGGASNTSQGDCPKRFFCERETIRSQGRRGNVIKGVPSHPPSSFRKQREQLLQSPTGPHFGPTWNRLNIISEHTAIPSRCQGQGLSRFWEVRANGIRATAL
jgi:hypothetical protein